jgi:hypothetical protein
VKFTDPDGRILRDVPASPKQQDGGSTALGSGTATVADVGCVLTATVRIAIAISGKQITLAQANEIAIDNNLYSGESRNLLSVESQAKLIGLLTGKEIGHAVYTGTEQELYNKVVELNQAEGEYYPSGRVHATNGDGTKKYDHQVNINKPTQKGFFSLGQGYVVNDGVVGVNDTSLAGRTTTAGRVPDKPETLFKLHVFWVKKEE